MFLRFPNSYQRLETQNYKENLRGKVNFAATRQVFLKTYIQHRRELLALRLGGFLMTRASSVPHYTLYHADAERRNTKARLLAALAGR
jgi:hypothetical protein